MGRSHDEFEIFEIVNNINEKRGTKQNQGPDGNELTLIFAIAALHFLMFLLLYVSLEDLGPIGFLTSSYNEDVGSIDPVIQSPSHHMIFAHEDFIHRHLRMSVSVIQPEDGCCSPALTPL